jgi:hypothetical protein
VYSKKNLLTTVHVRGNNSKGDITFLLKIEIDKKRGAVSLRTVAHPGDLTFGKKNDKPLKRFERQ